MSKEKAGILLSIFNLDTSSGCPPLYRQVYAAIREAILRGELNLKTRLPSTRTLAFELGVSRNTVLSAFEQLQAEGFLDSHTGSGSYVVKKLPTDLVDSLSQLSSTTSEFTNDPITLSKRGEAILAARTPASPAGAPRTFVPGVPALDAFPHQHWNRCVSHANRRLDEAALNYGASGGYLPLRNALASYLSVSRGVRCEPDQIMLISGVQQGLDLITRLLTDPGDSIWVEDPGHLGARSAFIAGQTNIVPVPVDEDGLIVDEAIKRCPSARLAYVTPSYQSPSGAILSLDRRMYLLDWARKNKSWIIEDDYDSEFRYKGHPLTALQGLTHDARVLYLGTFSKVLAPGIRLAYLVVPKAYIDVFSSGRRQLDTHSSMPIQIAMAEFIERGYFNTHIRRMRRLYEERQKILVEEVNLRLSKWVKIFPSPSGMHLVGYLHQGNDLEYSRIAAKNHIHLPPLSQYYIGTPAKSGLIFGYACVSPERIVDTIKQLECIFDNEFK